MQRILMDIYRAVLTVSWPIAILATAAAIAAFVIARMFAKSREEIRTLRIGLEHAPGPGLMGQGMKLWPGAAQYPPNQQSAEMVRCAIKEETARADRVERMMGYTRTLFFIAFVGAALIVAGRYFPPA